MLIDGQKYINIIFVREKKLKIAKRGNQSIERPTKTDEVQETMHSSSDPSDDVHVTSEDILERLLLMFYHI